MGERREVPPIVRANSANSADSAAMAATLAAAFADDPAMSWIIPDRTERLRRHPRFFRLPVAHDLEHGFALHSPASEVVTLWRDPRQATAGLGETLRGGPGYLRALGRRLPRAMTVSQALSAHYPTAFDFAYLHYAAVAPKHQGKGLAGAAIREGQAIASSKGLPIYLETAKLDNVAIYSRLGFTVTGEFDVPGGGPHFWSMLWRTA